MRERVGKSATIIDLSMMNKAELQTAEKLAPQNEGSRDNSLEDVTDLKNEDFIYVY